jgi:acyl-CoA synthetase (AMP-forming)/AMP-acid ligase II
MSVALPLTIPNASARNARWFAADEAVVDSATRLTYAELDALSLRAASLSPYQRPRTYHFVAELPRTSTNKALRLLREAARQSAGNAALQTAALQSTGKQ